MPKESTQVPVDLRIAVILPSDEVVETVNLAEEDNILIEQGFMTKEEAVAFYQYSMLLTGIAGSRTEFLGLYRAVKEAYNRQQGGLILPPGANTQNKIIF